MSVSCWVVGVSRVLPSVAKHHCFAPMVRFPWVVGGPVHPRGYGGQQQGPCGEVGGRLLLAPPTSTFRGSLPGTAVLLKGAL